MEDLNSDIKLKYKNMLTLIDQLYSIDVNSSEVNEKIQDLINHLREIRFIITNPCDQNILGELIQIDFDEIFKKMSYLMSFLKNEEKIWLFFFQMITNLITNNNANKIIIILKFLGQDTSTFHSFLQFFEKNNKILKTLAIFVYNLPISLTLSLSNSLYSNLNYVYLIKIIFIYFFEFEMKIEEKSQNNDLLEWIYFIICQIFSVESSQFKAIIFFYELFVSDKEEKLCKFNENHQKFFMFIFHLGSKIIENREQNCLIKEISNKLMENDQKNEFLTSENNNKFGLFLFKLDDFFTLIDWYNELNTSFLAKFEQNFDNSTALLSHELNLLNIWIKIFAIISHSGNYIPEIQIIFFQRKLLLNVLKLLKLINELQKKKEENGSTNKYDILFEGECKYELITTIIKFISNVVHLYKEAQDFILNENYLYLVISFSHIDEKNPLMKEWSVVLIRNLTEINPEIQKKIADLKLIDFDEKSKEILKKFQKE